MNAGRTEIAVHVRLDEQSGKWFVWVNSERFMGFKTEGDAVGVCRRLADCIAENLPADLFKVTYTPCAAKAGCIRKAAGA